MPHAALSLVLALAVVCGSARPASAGEASTEPGVAQGVPPGVAPAIAPRDVPMVLRPDTIKVPLVPAHYERRDLGWLHIAYTPNASERVKPLLADADAFRAKLAAELGQPVLDHVEVRIGRTPEEMAELAPAEIPPPAYAEGVAYPGLDLVILTLTAPRTSAATDLPEVFRHELAHIALEDAVGGHHVPAWFNEGLAVHQSGENYLNRMSALWDARLSGTILELSELDRGFPTENYQVSIAYAESADFVRFLLRQSDRARFASMIGRVHAGQPFDRALADAYGSDVRKLEYQWRGEVDRKFNYLPVVMGGSMLWALLFGVMVAAYVKRRRRAKATLERWEREEAALDSAIERAQRRDDMGEQPGPLAGDMAGGVAAHPDGALIRASSRIARGAPGMGDGRTPDSIAKIEHDGHWHTLH